MVEHPAPVRRQGQSDAWTSRWGGGGGGQVRLADFFLQRWIREVAEKHLNQFKTSAQRDGGVGAPPPLRRPRRLQPLDADPEATLEEPAASRGSWIWRRSRTRRAGDRGARRGGGGGEGRGEPVAAAHRRDQDPRASSSCKAARPVERGRRARGRCGGGGVRRARCAPPPRPTGRGSDVRPGFSRISDGGNSPERPLVAAFAGEKDDGTRWRRRFARKGRAPRLRAPRHEPSGRWRSKTSSPGSSRWTGTSPRQLRHLLALVDTNSNGDRTTSSTAPSRKTPSTSTRARSSSCCVFFAHEMERSRRVLVTHRVARRRAAGQGRAERKLVPPFAHRSRASWPMHMQMEATGAAPTTAPAPTPSPRCSSPASSLRALLPRRYRRRPPPLARSRITPSPRSLRRSSRRVRRRHPHRRAALDAAAPAVVVTIIVAPSCPQTMDPRAESCSVTVRVGLIDVHITRRRAPRVERLRAAAGASRCRDPTGRA